MSTWTFIPLFFLALAAPDLPKLPFLQSDFGKSAEGPLAGDRIPILPELLTTDPQQTAGGAKPAGTKATTLTEPSKLALIRFVSGEFAKVKRPIPGGKEGFILYTDKPINQEFLDRVIATHGAAINIGDNAQITKLEFREHMIVVDLNGGGRPKRNWRDRVQIGIGGPSYPQATTTTQGQETGPPGFQPGMGGTIFLQFPKEIPDLSPDDLKNILSPFLDFAREHSAAVHWIDTLPPEMKKAITERHPVLGMDREEVVAAIGKPDRKVRERDTEGYDTEDWIYGHPPDKTVFVHFRGDKVSSIKQYPQ